MRIFLANPTCRVSLENGKEKYFVRAGSRWPFSTVKKIKNKPEYIPFPFFLAYTAAVLEGNGHEVIVDDGVATNETEVQLLSKIKAEKPDVLLFETSTPTIDYDLNLVKKIKKSVPDAVVCLSGTHATVFAKQILKENPSVDYIFLGEYEINFADFIEALSRKKDLAGVKGIAFRKNREVVVNKQKPISNLNVLPFPARHLFPSNENPDPTVYWDGFCQYKPSVQMQASRGCPFQCNFCLWNQVVYQNGKYRFFSAKRVVDEMEEVVKKHGAKEIYFDDDTFTAKKRQVLDICGEINRRNLKIFWSVMGDAMITDEEMIRSMAEAGCIGIKFGVESGNREILKGIGKPIDLEKVRKFVGWCSKYKIKNHATFTFGLLGETKETMKETLEFAKSLDVDSVQFSLTTPFPGTRYFQQLKEEKRLAFQKWEDFDGAFSSVVKYPNFSQKEIVDFCRRASGSWLSNKFTKATWLLRQLYYLKRTIKGQGLKVIFSRFKRTIELLSA